MGDVENSEIPCTPWTTRMPKYAQPNLNYIGKKTRLKTSFRPKPRVQILLFKFYKVTECRKKGSKLLIPDFMKILKMKQL